MNQWREREAMVMERHIIGLERHNIDELEVVERLAAAIGSEAFEVDVAQLVKLHIVDPEAEIQTIPRLFHPSLIGMSDVPFGVLQNASDSLVEREPKLLEHPSYRCRNDQTTALPWTFWLALVRHARDFFDPAALDAEFLAVRLREGLSSREAFDALLAYKRGR
ncbi:hypothetical protein [Pseudomonas inefficax]|uniref:hypothetical protein n=1 Tax=Pseudomonas inefficax TaxID=2078786 RepID=UPI004047024A